MFKSVSVTHSQTLPFAQEKVVEVLHNISHLATYEPKVTQVQVEKVDENKGLYYPKGRFAGLPWRGKFDYHLNQKGFRSKMVKSPLKGLKVKGGFSTKKLGKDSCLLTHFEEYQLPRAFKLLNPLLHAYVKASMIKELKIIEEIVGKQKS